MGALKLPRLISNGMVLQQKKKTHIWGFDEAGRKVTVSFLGEEISTVTAENGSFELWLALEQPGGPFEMRIRDDAGEEITLSDIWVGDVFMCSGQSNMELPMARVKDRFPEEIKTCANPAIRTFKITEHSDFHGPLAEHLTGEWKEAKEDTILNFSATAYFFARQMYQMTGVPIGLINASLGGSCTESWMSREMLEGYEEELAMADKYADDDFVAQVLERNISQANDWHAKLDKADVGLKENWQNQEVDTSAWKPIELPCFFRDTQLNGFIGSIWLRRKFTVGSGLAQKPAKLWLGTLVDSDIAYVNGVEVGRTEYCYPPRKYEIPQGVLKEGENTVVIRLKCENGEGRVTDNKEFMVFNEEEKVNLYGTWLYRIGAECEKVPPTDFVNWKPTGLYNGMTAPCHAYTIAGVLWYQGEANAGPEGSRVHVDMMRRLIEGYRKMWKDDNLPFFYVQLPNFRMNIYRTSDAELDSAWAMFREAQRKVLEIPNTGMVVAIDLGEDNDLHPLNKKGVGTRLAMMAAARLYGFDIACDGPKVREITDSQWMEKGYADQKADYCVTLICENCKDGLYAHSADKGKEIRDFELVDAAGNTYPAEAEIHDNQILVKGRELSAPPVMLRYCYDFTNKGALLYNKDGFPMSPFVMNL